MQSMNLVNFFTNINPKEVLKNLPDAVLVIEFDGKITWVNDKATTIFEAGKSLLLNYYFDDLINNGLAIVEQSATRRTSYIAGAYTPNAKEFFIELNARQYDEQYFVTIRDVTAMTGVLANAERTGRLNKDKNLMIAKLSNDFKSPIQSIVGFSQALIDGLGGEISEKQGKYVKIINKNSNDLLGLMEKFLEFSQAESSLYELDYDNLDIASALQNVMKSNEAAITSKKLTLLYDDEELVSKNAYSDGNSLKLIFQNLLETSIKQTDLGTITVKILNPELAHVQDSGLNLFEGASVQSYVEVIISNTGMGLQEQDLDGLFEPYTQMDKVSKKNIIRALSLGTVHTILKRLKGAIWAESEIMKGTTYHVIIPVEKVPATVAPVKIEEPEEDDE